MLSADGLLMIFPKNKDYLSLTALQLSVDEKPALFSILSWDQKNSSVDYMSQL